jgi:hypothetical protein
LTADTAFRVASATEAALPLAAMTICQGSSPTPIVAVTLPVLALIAFTELPSVSVT